MLINTHTQIFYKELVEITLDFMSNNMYFNNALNQQLTPTHNHNEFYVDIYSNPSTDLNTATDLIGKPTGTTSNGQANTQSRRWLVGNKIIQIKTGLFSNICLDDPTSSLTRKQRVSSTRVSKPINIPMDSNCESSDNNSSTNNSFSKASVRSEQEMLFDDTIEMSSGSAMAIGREG